MLARYIFECSLGRIKIYIELLAMIIKSSAYLITIILFIQVFAFLGSVQAVVELIVPGYHSIYLYTIEWFPGFAYCISCGIVLIMLTVASYIRCRAILKDTKCKNMDINNNSSNKKIFDSVATCDPIYKQVTTNLVQNNIL